MSNAELRTNEVVGPIHEGDWTDHSGHNAYWCAFNDGYAQAETDMVNEIESILKWPPGENEVKKILRIEEMLKKYK